MPEFLFPLGSKVTIRASGEAGEVIGRAQYTNAADNYLIRYRCADGRAVEQWWAADALASEA